MPAGQRTVVFFGNVPVALVLDDFAIVKIAVTGMLGDRPLCGERDRRLLAGRRVRVAVEVVIDAVRTSLDQTVCLEGLAKLAIRLADPLAEGADRSPPRP